MLSRKYGKTRGIDGIKEFLWKLCGCRQEKSEKIPSGNMGKTENGCMEKKKKMLYREREKQW